MLNSTFTTSADCQSSLSIYRIFDTSEENFKGCRTLLTLTEVPYKSRSTNTLGLIASKRTYTLSICWTRIVATKAVIHILNNHQNKVLQLQLLYFCDICRKSIVICDGDKDLNDSHWQRLPTNPGLQLHWDSLVPGGLRHWPFCEHGLFWKQWSTTGWSKKKIVSALLNLIKSDPVSMG